MIKVSAPAKVHLLGEWSVVWGKPALLTTVDLRITVTIADTSKESEPTFEVRKIIEPIIKKELKIKKIPPYSLKIESDIPMGAHLGSSAAVSVASIAALLSFLKVKWDLDLINKLAYEAEKIFHGNPSGADNSTIVYGGLVWYRKENADLKIIQKLPFSIPAKLSKNFILINTGTPKETTRQMIEKISSKYTVSSIKYKKLFDHQEQLVKELLTAIKDSNEKELIRIIRAGERNLESIGVCSPEVSKIIRQIENAGGAAKICGAGATQGPTGVLLCYHKNTSVIEKIASENKLSHFSAKLGVEGVKQE
ncbi:mevalonate kinase [Candidatus Daviesbacteria bacterium RIFCSPLOWO2_12_FULL_38_10]|nr:MAG: mevalonate kinase [Candidatus Daviesbacteria bacterium RIFCSPLOWO2_12_FULL_38_10]